MGKSLILKTKTSNLVKFYLKLIPKTDLSMKQVRIRAASNLVELIEGGNIKYGNIEKCNIDSDLRSKIWRLVTLKR